MKLLLPAALLSVAAVASASSCSSTYTECLLGGTSGDCGGLIAGCKDSCSQTLDTCNQETGNSTSCTTQYSTCLYSTQLLSSSCVSTYDECRSTVSGFNGDSDHTCNAGLAECQQNCGVLKDLCDTSGLFTSAECVAQHGQCLDSFPELPAGSSCVEKYEVCRSSITGADGDSDNECSTAMAQCKDECANRLGACNTSGAFSTAQCNAQENSCLDSYPAQHPAGTDCVSKFYSCRETNNTSVCNTELAACKEECSVEYDAALSSGTSNTTLARSQYGSCLDLYTPAASGTDCTSDYRRCIIMGNSSAVCGASLAQCKDSCGEVYDTCNTSGFENKTACLQQYQLCYDDVKSAAYTLDDCVSRYEESKANGNSDAFSSSLLADCKQECSLIESTCEASGDTSEWPICKSQYQSCLDSFSVSFGSSSVPDCVTSFRESTMGNSTDAESSALLATCKNDCSSVYSTCLSSGETEYSGACLNQYNSCLVSFNSTLFGAGTDCASKLSSWKSSGLPDNVAQANMATCTNDCSDILSTCLSSGDATLKQPCADLNVKCLGYTPAVNTTSSATIGTTPSTSPIAISTGIANVTSAGTSDPVSSESPRISIMAASTSAAPYAYKNATASLPLTPSVDPSTEPATVLPSTTVTDVIYTTITTCPAGETLTSGGSTTVLSTPSIITTTVTSQSTVTGYVTVFASSKAFSAQTTSAATTHTTDYVTKVVYTTITTCPAGETLTESGSTTVLTAPSVITSTITYSSLVTATVTETMTSETTPASTTIYTTSTAYTTKTNTITSTDAVGSTTTYVTEVVTDYTTVCPVTAEASSAASSAAALTAPIWTNGTIPAVAKPAWAPSAGRSLHV